MPNLEICRTCGRVHGLVDAIEAPSDKLDLEDPDFKLLKTPSVHQRWSEWYADLIRVARNLDQALQKRKCQNWKLVSTRETVTLSVDDAQPNFTLGDPRWSSIAHVVEAYLLSKEHLICGELSQAIACLKTLK